MKKNSTVVASVALFAVSLATAQPVLVFSERDFAPGSIDVSVNGWAGVGGLSVVRESVGGNPGPWLRVRVDVAGGNPAPFSGNSTFGMIVLAGGRTIDPAALGGVASITYSADARFISLSPPTVGGCGCSGQDALVRQNGNIYIGSMPTTPGFNPAWGSATSGALVASSFQRLLFQNPAVLDPNAHPDFSANGAPFEVGISRANSNSTPPNDGAYSVETGLDNLVISATGCLRLTHQPASQTVCPSGAVQFSVSADAAGPLTFAWQLEDAAVPGGWRTLANGPLIISGITWGTISDATTATLRAQPDPLTSYIGSTLRVRAVVTNACAAGGVTSNPATLTICVADTDDGSGTGVCDGGVTIDDLLYYLFIFEEGSIAADVDDGSGGGTPDGGVTIDDLLYYLQRFEAGC